MGLLSASITGLISSPLIRDKKKSLVKGRGVACSVFLDSNEAFYSLSRACSQARKT